MSSVEATIASELRAALDELVAEQILLFENGNYRFAQQPLREALLGQMDDTRRRAQHLVLRRQCSARRGVGSRDRSGPASLQAGEEERGAQILANAGSEYLSTRAGRERGSSWRSGCTRRSSMYDASGVRTSRCASCLFALVRVAYIRRTGK